MTELPDRLRRLSRRGTERGADAVFEAATTDAAHTTSARRFGGPTMATALAAAVLLVGGVASAMVIDTSDDAPAKRPSFAAAATTSTAPTTTTSALALAPSTPKIYLASTRLVPFDSCPTLASYARQRALDTVTAYGLPYPGGSGGGTATGGVAAGRAVDDSAGSPAPAAAPAASAVQEFSGTNVQEAGIDEPDLVKTDGRTIFAIANGTKVYATAAGDNPRVLGSIDVPGAQDLFLSGDKLVVISNGGVYATDARFAASSMPAYAPQPTRISVYDVTNPASMKLAGSVDVEGGYISARLIDGVARIAVRSYPRVQFTYPTDGSPEAQAAALAHNRDVIRATKADTWLPHFTVRDGAGKTVLNGEPLAGCANSYRPPSFSGFGMLSVLTLNTDIPTRSRATSVMADGQIVYASAKRMYVATNAWQDVQNNQVVNAPSTLVHAFDIGDSVVASYAGSGKVRGNALNQFALSEHNGLLRIATTDEVGGFQSFVTVLQDNGEALVQIGQVGGLGHEGERIFGVRFIGDAAYVVTFRQTDPLYVVDLSDPTKPVVKGELKVTGYSAYLHPIAPGRLLGIGQDVGANGQQGLQASVFDVADPSNPKLLSRTVIGGSYSNAQHDHHAFLYWAPKKLAVVPLSAYSNPNEYFNGALGMRVEDAAITEVGRMQVPNSQQSPQQDRCCQMSPGIDRTIVIGDRVYAMSSAGVLVNTFELKSTAWVPYE